MLSGCDGERATYCIMDFRPDEGSLQWWTEGFYTSVFSKMYIRYRGLIDHNKAIFKLQDFVIWSPLWFYAVGLIIRDPSTKKKHKETYSYTVSLALR